MGLGDGAGVVGVVGVVGAVGVGAGVVVELVPLDADELVALTAALFDADNVEVGRALLAPHPEIIAAATAMDASAARLTRRERVKCIVPPKPCAG